MAYRQQYQGFTLLEVLVVLVITSMLSLLLIDGVSQVMFIEKRMAAKTRSFRSNDLQQYWFRQVLSGGLASRQTPFQLREGSVRGLTLSPLLTDDGIPTPFELLIVAGSDGSELRYRERDEPYIALLRWSNTELTAAPSFVAVNSEGTYDANWVSKQDGPQWPNGLALRVPLLAGQSFWHVAIPGRKTPRINVTDALGI